MTIPTRDYLRLRFVKGGRERPDVDCWGLYRLIVAEQTGVTLPEFPGRENPLAIVRTLKRQRGSGGWAEVGVGHEQPFDLVLMNGLVGEGRETISAPLHVGCVVERGTMIDIEEGSGVTVRAYRDTLTKPAHPKVRHRVLGIYRSELLA